MGAILWLDDITVRGQALVGGKALRLAEVKRAGFPVPDGFCISVQAYEGFVAENGLESAICPSPRGPDQGLSTVASRLQEAFRAGRMAPQTRDAIVAAYRSLTGRGGMSVPSVAVRSSATTEDLPTASFAGQQSTFLNVCDEGQLLQAIVECWASLWSPRAVAYRAQQRVMEVPAIAVLVQRMVAAEAAGVAFSQDPVTGEARVVIEAALGLGETVVSGGSDVDRYVVSRATCQESEPPFVAHKQRQCLPAAGGGVHTLEVPLDMQNVRVLTARQVEEIGRAALALEEHFGRPQDVEWALADERIYILQSRPITRVGDPFFTDVVPEDAIWTSGFLNERFSLPVSPLGWTLISELLDRLAFRDPLRYLGLKDVERLRITRLYRGHPYVNLFVFQTLYKVFPTWLLPEDSYRYFPAGQTELRHRVAYPRSLLDPRFLLSMARHFLQRPALWSPWHNYRVWADFTAWHNQRSQELEVEYERLPAMGPRVNQVWGLIRQAQDLDAELLAVHRWSLTCADLAYSLLRRLVGAWVKEENATTLCAHLVTGLPNKSVQVDHALRSLARQSGETTAFDEALQTFLRRYGHRSFHLDIYYPSFADEPAQVLDLVQRVRSQGPEPWAEHASLHQDAMRRVHQVLGRGPLGWAKRTVFDHLARLARRYMPLREEQRFYWQRTLALQRKLFLLLGRDMARSGALQEEQDIFFLTLCEVEAYVGADVSGAGPGAASPRRTDGREGYQYAELAASRKREFWRLSREAETMPESAYPPFLRGNQPLALGQRESETLFRGRAVSPGLAQGRVVILHSPAEFGKVMPGDVLVASGVDPGWTPVFGLLCALILEHGGQLSHAAVVAREYGLPAVAGIQGITGALRDGDVVLVDGLNGLVSRVA